MEKNALTEIFNNLKAGKEYGKYKTNCRFPYFETSLAANKRYIFWSHFGSSANKATIKDLAWILSTIFEMTPEQFIKDYTIYSENNILGA